MRVYAETSAVLALLVAEPPAPLVREELSAARLVVASSLTILEARRVIVRGEAIAAVTAARASELRADLARICVGWSILSIDDDVLGRAERRFPREPIRALDAIHLATALAIRETVGPITLLSLDERLRRSAVELGFPVAPALGDTINEAG